MKRLIKVSTIPTIDDFKSGDFENKEPYVGLAADNKEVFYTFKPSYNYLVELPDGYVWAKDEDFEWKTGYPFVSGGGAWHYIGVADKVAIPYIIQDRLVTSYVGMFYETSISGVYNDNPSVTDMSYMFSESTAISLDLTHLDTSNVTNMTRMFAYSKTKSLDLSNFDTSNVIDMSVMFYKSQATSLNLSNFNTSKVTDMSYMFANSLATTLDLSRFDTRNVTDMAGMFASSGATILDLSSFDVWRLRDSILYNILKDCRATKGYAKTTHDAFALNDKKITNIPSSLWFTVK